VSDSFINTSPQTKQNEALSFYHTESEDED